MLGLGLGIPEVAVRAGGEGAFQELPAPSPVLTAFDPAGANSTNVLSDSNRTVTNPTGGTSNSVIRSVKSVTAGKYHASFTINTLGGGAQVGLIETTQSLATTGTFLANLAKAAGIPPDGNVYSGTSFATIGNLGSSYVAGDTVEIALDATARKIWVRKNGAGNWNASGTANPATGVGGLTLAAGMTGAIHLAVGVHNGTSITMNPDPASKPSGFVGWTDGVPIDVYIVAGQSNASGWSTDSNLSWRRDPNILAWNASALVEYRPGVVTGFEWGAPAGRWSFEAELLRQVRVDNPTKRVAVLKYAAGGSQLYQSGSNAVYDWHPSSTAELFNNGGEFVANGMAALRAAGYDPTIRMLVWDQGENDAVNQTYRDAYQTNLAALVAGFRNAGGNWKVPASGKIAINRMSSGFNPNATIRAAQKAICDADTGGPQWLVDTDDLPLEADNTHRTKPALITLGGRLRLVDLGTYTQPS